MVSPHLRIRVSNTIQTPLHVCG